MGLSASKEFEGRRLGVTSIYYDNPDTWDLYEERLQEDGGRRGRSGCGGTAACKARDHLRRAQTHRRRTGRARSRSATLLLKEKNVNAYMRGELLPAAIFEKGAEGGQEVAQGHRRGRAGWPAEVQWSVLKKGLHGPSAGPSTTAPRFQLPADARVRISLDTELTMVREDNLDGARAVGRQLAAAPDIGIDYPFSQLPPGDVVQLPLRRPRGQAADPAGPGAAGWVAPGSIASHLVEAVPKFSKFIRGIASLFPDHIHLLPYWMPQMDVGIRKPVSHDFGIQRPRHSSGDDDLARRGRQTTTTIRRRRTGRAAAAASCSSRSSAQECGAAAGGQGRRQQQQSWRLASAGAAERSGVEEGSRRPTAPTTGGLVGGGDHDAYLIYDLDDDEDDDGTRTGCAEERGASSGWPCTVGRWRRRGPARGRGAGRAPAPGHRRGRSP